MGGRELLGGAGDAGARREHLAVQQSPSPSLDEFVGLPGLEALRHRLRHVTHEPFGASAEVQQNLWVNRPPTLSQLHYDTEDSL